MSEELYIGRGSAEMYDDYIDFINYVFGMSGEDGGFKTLLPKLYGEKYHPCEANYVVRENGKFKSAVGAFDSVLDVCGMKLKRRGIGNVAVHPYSRGKGYMKTLLKTAVSDMIADGVDISDLGGRRQRYGFFSYERGGVSNKFSIGENNFRYVYGSDVPKKLAVAPVFCDDEMMLTQIRALHNARPLHMERPDDAFFDILKNWHADVHAYYDGERFVGYTVSDGSHICEISLADDALFINVLYTFFCMRAASVTISLPLWQDKLARLLYPLAEDVSPENGEMYTIFNFERVISAFMKLRAESGPMCEGSLTVRINGVARTETLLIKVENGVPTVSRYDGEPSLVLEHKCAISFFFGVYSPHRAALGRPEASWFPLPIFISSPDAV